MKCHFCGQELPEGAKFCYKCHKQIICLGCGGKLIEGASVCVYCGRMLDNQPSKKGMNHIVFTESENTRSFEASFSDESAENIASVFSRILKGDTVDSLSDTLVIDNQSQPQGEKNAPLINNPQADSLKRIFREKDGVVSLVEKRLKAKTKTDQQARASMLLLLYYKQYMKDKMTRNVLYDFMRAENLYDSTYRAWLSHHAHFFLRDENVMELSPEGEEVANGYLKEVFDESIDSVWKSSSPSQSSKVRASANESRSPQPQMVSTLDLSPEGKESLAAFMSRHKYRKSSSQQNLLFVYYLKQVLQLPNVTQDHVYTCYRELGAKLPNDLYHSLSDNISKNRWLMNISDLTLTTKGLNFVEHDMTDK